MLRRPPRSTLFPTRRSSDLDSISWRRVRVLICPDVESCTAFLSINVNIDVGAYSDVDRSEEHTSELQSRFDLVCRLLLEKKKKNSTKKVHKIQINKMSLVKG